MRWRHWLGGCGDGGVDSGDGETKTHEGIGVGGGDATRLGRGLWVGRGEEREQ